MGKKRQASMLNSVDPTPPVVSTKPVSKGEETTQQTVFGIPGITGLSNTLGGPFPGIGYLGFGAGFGSVNGQYNAFGAIGMGANGWPLNTWSNYELMDRNPTVACAAAVADAPGKATEIAYESKPWADPEWVEFIKEQMAPWETYLLNYGHRCLDDGFAAMEVVYESGNWNFSGSIRPATVLQKLKFLFPWATQPRVDVHGNLTGIENQGVTISDPRRCLWIPYDDRGVYLYGRSRKNNFLKYWLNDEFLSDFLQYAMSVIVKPFGKVSYPYNPAAGSEASNAQALKNAQSVGAAMAAGQWVNLPNPFVAVMDQMIKLGLKPDDIDPYKIDWFKPAHDSGEAFERLFGVTGRGIVMGHLRSPRTMMEAQHGSKADSKEHGDDGDLIGVQPVNLILGHANRTIINTLLVQNYGPEASGSVWMQPSKAGKNLELTNSIILSLFQKGAIPPTILMRIVALKPEFEKAGVATLDFDQEALIEEMEKQQQQQQRIDLGTAANAKGKADEKKASLGADEVKAGELPEGWEHLENRMGHYFQEQKRDLLAGSETDEEKRKRDEKLAALLLALLLPWVSDEAELAAVKVHGTPVITALAIKQVGKKVSQYAFKTAQQINQTTREAIDAGGDDRAAAIESALSEDRIAYRKKLIAEDQAYKMKMWAQVAVVSVLPDVVGWYWRAYPDACINICRPLDGSFHPIKDVDNWFEDNAQIPGWVHVACRCVAEVLMSDGTTYIL